MATHTWTQTPAKPSKGLHIGLWVAQILLALAFGMAGSAKLASPIAALAAQGMTFVTTMPEGLVRFIGLSEVAGALGMLLPALTRIKPVLTAWAGVGLSTVMVLAIGYHLSHGEAAHVAPPLVLLALAAFVAWGRFKAAPILPRG